MPADGSPFPGLVQDDLAVTNNGGLISIYYNGGGFVDADTQHARVFQNDCYQPVVAHPVDEVLIDDGVFQETEPGGQFHIPGFDGTERSPVVRVEYLFASDHFLAHDGSAGAGACNDGAVAVGFPNGFLDGASLDRIHEAGLDAAAEVD